MYEWITQCIAPHQSSTKSSSFSRVTTKKKQKEARREMKIRWRNAKHQTEYTTRTQHSHTHTRMNGWDGSVRCMHHSLCMYVNHTALLSVSWSFSSLGESFSDQLARQFDVNHWSEWKPHLVARRFVVSIERSEQNRVQLHGIIHIVVALARKLKIILEIEINLTTC